MKTETPWIIRSLNASNCNGSATDCVKEMLKALKRAAYDIEEMGCTCVDRSAGHQRDCMGVQRAKQIRAAIAKAEAL